MLVAELGPAGEMSTLVFLSGTSPSTWNHWEISGTSNVHGVVGQGLDYTLEIPNFIRIWFNDINVKRQYK